MLLNSSVHAPGTRRNKYRSARAFYLFLLIGVLLALVAYHTHSAAYAANAPGARLLRRGDNGPPALSDDEQCRLVHRSADQCAFIKKHCPDDEAGFTVYLDLYYCRLHSLKPLAFTILISWLGLLFSTIGIAASDFFCINLSTIANIMGMSESMAGVTLLAFGNGSPDVFSTFSAMSTNSGSLAVGELMGAAGFITAVVAGSMALIKPFHVARKSFVRDVGFFIVAAAFSLVFLHDGRLHLWECITMVVYYCFYVTFVVVWHWWIGRKKAKREKLAAVRDQFMTPGDELGTEEVYQDEPGEHPSRMTLSRGASREDFAALERGAGTPFEQPDEDEEEEARDRWMSELNSNMRLARTRASSRRNTITPVRPSLVGALEFQAVLNSLQKSRNIQTIPLNSRRYSDDPGFTTVQQQEQLSSEADPARRPPYEITLDSDEQPTLLNARPNLNVSLSAPGPARSRAASANSAPSLRVDSDLRRPSQDLERTGDLIDLSEDTHSYRPGLARLDVPHQAQQPLPETPTFEISSPPLDNTEQETMSGFTPNTVGKRSPKYLAAVDADSMFSNGDRPLSRKSTLRQTDASPSPDLPQTVPKARQLPKIVIPRDRRSRDSTPCTSPFPAYLDDFSASSSRAPSLYLPQPILSPESVPACQPIDQPATSRPISWWPYKLFPPPGVLISTLFPTIYHWHDKSIWEKMIGVVAAPSVFLLTITLPVVESDKSEEGELPAAKHASYDSARRQSIGDILNNSTDTLKRAVSPDPTTPGSHIHHHHFAHGGPTGKGNSATLAAATESQYRHIYGSQPNDLPSIAIEQPTLTKSPAVIPDDTVATSPSGSSSEPWPRWLALLHVYTAPLFCILAVYLQQPSTTASSWLLLPMGISTSASTFLLLAFIYTTTATTRPGPLHRILFSAAGFIVSIAWISSIADQVVGALKALAVICNMSHAIMGLTIFAVGNSLGDLVADVTVARLGYPVMALSACFGGPMLNILLGIGLSGTYIQLTGAQRRQHKHPNGGLHFKAYHIDVGRTLIVSGITLVITLLGLLIFVPMNGWVLSRRIGWVLIAVWTVSTIGNVALEVSGWGSEH